MGFEGLTVLYNFGLIGYIISIIYIFIVFIIHKRYDIRSIVSYIIFICYYSAILIFALGNEQSVFAFALLPYYNFLFLIPIIISFILELLKFIKIKIDIKKGNITEENETKNKTIEQNICLFILIIIVCGQIFSGRVVSWWEYQGKRNYELKKADLLILNEKYADAIDILIKYSYDDKAKSKINQLNYKEVKKLYDNRKYEKCIELKDLLLDKVKSEEYDLRSGVYYTEYYLKSYLELYNIAKSKNDYAKMSEIKGKIINCASEEELKKMGFEYNDFDIFTELKYAKKGAIVKLGKYYQESSQISNNKSDVEWYVSDVTDNTISLIAKKVLLEVNFSFDEFNKNNKCIFDNLNKENGFIDDIFSENIQNMLIEDKNGYKISLVRDKEILDYINYVGYKYNCFRNLHTNYINTPQFVVSINENSLLYDGNEKNYLRFIPDKYNLEGKDIISLPMYFREIEETKKNIESGKIINNIKLKNANRRIKYVGIMPRIIINKTILDNAKNVITNEIISEKNDLLSLVSSQIRNAKCVTEYDENTEVKDIDSIKFGKAPKNSKKNKYEWIVLEKKDGKALLLSKYILNAYSYYQIHGMDNAKKEECVWENSDVRRELNEWFYDDSFDDYEKELIIDTNVINSKNERFGTKSGRNTIDKIFILSADECNKYFYNNNMEYNDKNKDNKKLAGTKNKKYKNYWVQDLYKESKEDEWFSSCSRFWLRTQGEMWWTACFVDSNGFVNTRGLTINQAGIGIRPAMWIKYK